MTLLKTWISTNIYNLVYAVYVVKEITYKKQTQSKEIRGNNLISLNSMIQLEPYFFNCSREKKKEMNLEKEERWDF